MGLGIYLHHVAVVIQQGEDDVSVIPAMPRDCLHRKLVRETLRGNFPAPKHRQAQNQKSRI